MKQLYKYCGINSNTTSCLLDRYAWYPKPSTLNDPFDCGLSQSLMGVNDQWGVLSLSAVSSNIIMWSHYADSHRGICIEYTDYSDVHLNEYPLKSRVKPYGESPETLPIIRNAIGIKYLSTEQLNDQLQQLPQSLDDFNTALKEYNSGELTKLKYANGFLIRGMKALFMKHNDWSYEREYRIVTHDGNKRIVAPGLVTTIFLGMHTTAAQSQQIYRIGTDLGAKVLKMERVERKYELAPRELRDNERDGPGLDVSPAVNNQLKKLETP